MPETFSTYVTLEIAGGQIGTSDITIGVYSGQTLVEDDAGIHLSVVNDLPVAVGDPDDEFYLVAVGTPLVVSAGSGVLINDYDLNNDPLTAHIDDGPAHGSVNLAEDGSFTYTPTGTYVGTDSFTYYANDGMDDSCMPATVSIVVFRVDAITPGGHPVSSPVDSGDGQNEFTYSPATTGVLTMTLKASVTPSGIAERVKDRCIFTVESISGSTMDWDDLNPGGVPRASGDYLLATVTFTGLPADNSAFGTKTAKFYVDGGEIAARDYEVFFPRDATNHPGGQAGSPNWFYYWGQVYVANNVHYVAAAGTGRTPAMANWSYTAAQDKTRIEIGSGQPARYRSYGVGEETSGIDRYIMTVIHEQKHVAQIAAADVLMPASNGSDAFRYGWSFNQPTDNHWTKGPDGEWGVADEDDDANGTIDDAGATPPFEPGGGDDVSLENASWSDWPAAWPLPASFPGNPGLSKLEVDAIRTADAAMNENDYASQDWGDPGKQHQTINDWSD
jgi:hypothetical protein